MRSEDSIYLPPMMGDSHTVTAATSAADLAWNAASGTTTLTSTNVVSTLLQYHTFPLDQTLLQKPWDLILHYGNPYLYHWLFAGWLTFFSFTLFCLFFTWKDVFRHDSKVDKSYWPTYTDMVQAGASQMVIYFCLNALFTWIYPELTPLPKEAPSLSRFVVEVAVAFLAGDFFIYWEHRIMHTIPYLRKNIHYVHHIYHSPFSWAGGVVHPLEDAVVVACQVTVPLMFKFHPLSFWFFVFWWVAFLIEEHSGHDVIWAPWHWLPFTNQPYGGGATPHTPHHMYPTVNYGFVFLIWDHLFTSYTAPTVPLRKPTFYKKWWEWSASGKNE
eukprot:TRINITY_DN3970_c0_g1_i2.p1 TRINITY_DN3970_c0_g1~~TRINITY_DN3970_c0_g1_i2.p1  ORF type:complete len:328 (-),score=53.13 TRINITY_DN3970_c0_g1_i2:21-1004(-)